jgi:hypothetical protein
MWKELAKFSLALGTGDVMGAVDALTTKAPATTGEDLPECKEGDPPCKRTCDGMPCLGHGFGGACLYGTPPKKAEP